MNETLNTFLQLVLRWAHVVVGVIWIGHLYFFNWVNGPFQGKIDGPTKKAVNPELLPRALYWFRWGAAYTWVSGFLLAGMVYYDSETLLPPDSTLGKGAGVGLSLLLIVAVFFVYDALWKAMAKNEQAGVIASFILVAVLILGMWQVFAPRAVYIHVGMLFGTIMAMNVWMRIWPAQKKVIAATKAGTPPDAAIAGMAGLRSKHNTYMSVPLVLSMISNHYATVYGSDHGWITLIVLVAIGWGLTKLLYMKAAGPAPARF